MASFLKKDGQKVLFAGKGELIYYIPERYFNIKASEVVGDAIITIGMFTYAVFEPNGKRSILKPFNCPTMIQCIPNSVTKENNLHLDGTSEPAAYRLLHFKEGDELICNTSIPVDFAVLEKFIDIFKGGKLPENIPYDKIQDYIFDNAKLCSFDYKVSNQIIGMVISEIYRSNKDLSKPFRLAKTDDMLAYKAVSIDNVPKYTSPFTSITSDNADEAIAAAMTSAGNTESPLEKIVMA